MKTAFLNSLMYLHLACIVLLCLPSVGFAQHGASVPKPPKAAKPPSARELADLHYTAKHYAKALPYLLEYQKEKPRDIETKERIGRCFLEMALPERAQPYFETLTEGKTPRTDIYPDLAKAHHLQGHYEEAIKYYKLAIANLDTKNPQREALKAEVARCARAIKMAYATQRGYVENLGEAINSADDEFAPIVPSNAESLMFFSAIHERNVGGYHDNEGKPDPKGILTADIY